MQDYTIAEQLYGAAVAGKMREVDEALEAINQKHKLLFADIPSSVSDEEGATAKLQDYIMQDWRPADNVAGIGFRAELPLAIANECREAFNKIIGAD